MAARITPSQTITSTTPAALDLKLEAMVPLRWPNKLAVEDVAVSCRFRSWGERSAAEGEDWLRRSAGEGDPYAMECLGLRLTNGHGLQKNPDEGLAWLRRAAEMGNPIAMVRVAECLLEREQSAKSRDEAEEWLRTAIGHGNPHAAITLGTMLITGTGLLGDPEGGRQLLVEAAHDGSQLAHIKMGVYLLSGRGLLQDKEAGLRWLRRIGVTQPAQLPLVSYYIYMKSLAAPTRVAATLLAEDAGVLFYESLQQGNEVDGVNLAYLIRRREISDAPYPTLDALLSPYLRQNKPFALINQALRLAKAIQCNGDWELADILVGKIQGADGVLRWWFTRAEEGDSEGHLVTGWLVRRHLTTDPEQLPLARRMGLAREGGWAAPAWMDHPVGL